MASAPQSRFRPGRVAGLVVLVVAGLLLARWLFAPQPPESVTSPFSTTQVVVLGVETQPAVSDEAASVLDRGNAQVGVLRVPTGPDQCAAAGFASISAGEVVETGPICHPEVTPDGAIADWHELQEYAGGRLGSLAEVTTGCTAAVGPEAALAGARRDGTVSVYQPFEQFTASGQVLECPLTFIAAPTREDADTVLAELAGRDDVTVIVAGLGPDRDGRRPQLVYRTNAEDSGMLVGRDERTGSLDLADLSAALLDLDPTLSYPPDQQQPRLLRVVEGEVSAEVARSLLRDTRQLIDREDLLPAGLIGVLLVAGLLIGARLWWRSGSRAGAAAVAVVGTVATTWPAALLLAGASGWWRGDHPAWSAALTTVAWWGACAAAAVLVTRWRGWPSWLAGVVVSVVVGVVHAWVGLPWLRGSLLDRGTDASATATAMTACLLVLLGHFARWRRWAGLRRLGAPWLTLLVAVLAAAAVFLRVRSEVEWVDLVVILLGLGAWTVVHAWLAPGPSGTELGLPGLRVPVLIAITVIAVVAPDPVWAWFVGSLTFAVVAAAARLSAPAVGSAEG
ncbi:hypothetical protein [Enemella sp. A6]|uniref:hypothetical protein n=1 Tax=Enemella sp. A6 TaxID=3440152 RepID=UPI003EBE7B25